MNFFEKMKLKALLRNCNYELAGTVLKQQFYDHDKVTELNRLIDTLIKEPSFDHALKIIQYNEMYVFYFTESCHDGLYVRKNPKAEERKAEAAASLALEPKPSPQVEQDEQSPQPTVPTHRSSSIGNSSIEERFAELEAVVHREHGVKLLEEEKKELLGALVEEERALTQAEAAAASAPYIAEVAPEAEPYSPEPQRGGYVESTEAQEAGPVSELSRASRRQETDLGIEPITRDWPKTEPAAVKEASREKEQSKENKKRSAKVTSKESSLKDSIKESLKKLVREVASDPAPAAEANLTSEAEPEPVPPEAIPEDEAIVPDLSRFKNVIATLQIDIDEMKRQREEYQQMIYNNEPGAVKYKRWVVSLDEAIEEFSGAVRTLNRIRK